MRRSSSKPGTDWSRRNQIVSLVPTVRENMVKVDSKGRIMLPQAVRERLGITPGTEVEVREEDGRVVVEVEDDPQRIIERMDELSEGIPADRERVPYDELDPISRDHVDAIQRQAEKDDTSNE